MDLLAYNIEQVQGNVIVGDSTPSTNIHNFRVKTRTFWLQEAVGGYMGALVFQSIEDKDHFVSLLYNQDNKLYIAGGLADVLNYMFNKGLFPAEKLRKRFVRLLCEHFSLGTQDLQKALKIKLDEN